MKHDTNDQAARVQLELQQQMTPDQRMALMNQLSNEAINSLKSEIAERISDPLEAKIEFVRVAYGDDDLARRFGDALRTRALEKEDKP
jgi:hypothetical protein